RVRVNFVQVADARKEPARLDAEPVRQPDRLNKPLFDCNRIVGLNRSNQRPAKGGVDVRTENELRFAKAESAVRRPDFAARWREPANAIRRRISLEVAIGAVQDQRDAGIERALARGSAA